jgi:three-Cys-motif partner protein
MTSSRGGQGQSRDTEHKQRGIRHVLITNLKICASSRFLKWRPYYHFDLFAGCGWNHQYDVIGSPLAFWEAVEETGHPRPIAHFVDINAKSVAELRARPEMLGRQNCFVHHMDNAEFIRTIPRIIRGDGVRLDQAVGTILLDPNGPTEMDYDAIADVLHQCPMLDVIYNFCGTGTKRLPDGHMKKIVITDIPDLFHKKHWLIRQNIGDWQWSLLIGRNYRVGDHQSQGFHHWDSERGQHFVRTLATTRREQREQHKKNQGELFL